MAENTEINYVPVYYGSPEEAYVNGYNSPDGRAFRSSFHESVRCAHAMQRFEKDHAFDAAFHEDEIAAIVQRFGPDMVKTVLAAQIVYGLSRNIVSSDEKLWASDIRLYDSPAISMALDAELLPGTIDRFIGLAEEMAPLASDYAEAAPVQIETGAENEAMLEAEPEETAETENDDFLERWEKMEFGPDDVPEPEPDVEMPSDEAEAEAEAAAERAFAGEETEDERLARAVAAAKEAEDVALEPDTSDEIMRETAEIANADEGFFDFENAEQAEPAEESSETSGEETMAPVAEEQSIEDTNKALPVEDAIVEEPAEPVTEVKPTEDVKKAPVEEPETISAEENAEAPETEDVAFDPDFREVLGDEKVDTIVEEGLGMTETAEETAISGNALTVTIPRDGAIDWYSKENLLIVMPRGTDFENCLFTVKNEDAVKNDDGTVTITVRANDEGNVRITRLGEELTATLDELKSGFAAAEGDDEAYVPVVHSVKVPAEAVYDGNTSESLAIKLPENSKFAGKVTSIPKALEKGSYDDNVRVFSVPDYVSFGVKTGDLTERIPSEEFASIMSKADYKKKLDYDVISVSSAAILQVHPTQTYLKMPNGTYGGYAYYIPNGMIERDSEDSPILKIKLPPDREIPMSNIMSERTSLTVAQYRNFVDGLDEDYYVKGGKKSNGISIQKPDRKTRDDDDVPVRFKNRTQPE